MSIDPANTVPMRQLDSSSASSNANRSMRSAQKEPEGAQGASDVIRSTTDEVQVHSAPDQPTQGPDRSSPGIENGKDSASASK
jgi:hypothetical protein